MSHQPSAPLCHRPLSDPRSRRRTEDARFLTGHGRYVGDLVPQGSWHAAFLRSPHAHARIDSIDTQTAQNMAGVKCVLTAKDVNRTADHPNGLGPLPTSIMLGERSSLHVPHRDPLCARFVRHVGDLVAMVVADCPIKARDALEQIRVDYHPLDAVIDPLAALKPGCPAIWPEAPGNQAFTYQRGDHHATEAAFASADHCVELSLVNNRIAAAALEPRCATATWDAQTRRFHLDVSAASLHFIRNELAEAVLDLPPDQLRVTSPDVGGGFGMKNVTYPEYALLLWAARALNRSIHWTAERMDEFQSGVHGRDNITHARLALDRKGRFLALDVDTIANIGAYITSLGPGSATTAPTPAMGGLYAIPALSMRVRGVFTNMAPIDAYRGAGKPEANYMLERLIDCAAHTLNKDPAALRRLNFISRFPYTNATGFSIDSGQFAKNLDKALETIDRAGFAKRRALSKNAGRLRGIGFSCFLETARGPADEEAWLRPSSEGHITIVVGTQSNGQGHETSFPQLMEQLLNIPQSLFRYHQADTGMIPTGGGHGGARSLHMAGAALVLAAQDFIDKAKSVAGHLLQVDPARLAYHQGVFFLAGLAPDQGPHLTIEAVLAALDDRDPSLAFEGHGAIKQAPITFPNGCHAAEVEVDPQTGKIDILRYVAVDDYGRLINPMLTESQVQGGIAQGIGQAVMEGIRYDPDTGQLLTASFMDYATPRASDLPAFSMTLVECPTTANPLGVKGAGQAGAIGAPPAIINALVDALKPYGIRHIDMPATPAAVFAAIQAARKQETHAN